MAAAAVEIAVVTAESVAADAEIGAVVRWLPLLTLEAEERQAHHCKAVHLKICTKEAVEEAIEVDLAEGVADRHR